MRSWADFMPALDGKNIILFSSDVTARGMDYPGVSLVVQVRVGDETESV